MNDSKPVTGVRSAPVSEPGGSLVARKASDCIGPPTMLGEQAATAFGIESNGSGGRESLMPRSAADDERIALHEIGGHALVSVLLHSPLGGVSCEPSDSDGHSGLCWGPTFRSKFAGGNDAPTLCAQIGPLMPGPGEPRADVADIYLHVHTRVVELCAGSVAEALFLPGEPWAADSDRAQERALASLICSSPESIERFIDFCMAEAAALLRPREHIVRALTKELLIRRTMNAAQIDAVIDAAVVAKAAADERQRRLDWKRIEQSAASFADSSAGTLPVSGVKRT